MWSCEVSRLPVCNPVLATDITQGLHIYMGGVGLQELFIIIFGGLAVKLYLDIRREQSGHDRSKALLLLQVVFVALLLITVSAPYRLANIS